MKRSNRLIVTLAWVQLVISLMLASAIVWGYMTYQASVGQFVTSLRTSISAMSNVVIRTAETFEARQELLVETEKTLAITRERITELAGVTEGLAANVPKIADGISDVAMFVGKVGGTLESIGDKLMLLSVPTDIHFDGLKPHVLMSHPLERQAEAIRGNAKELKAASEKLSGTSTFIHRDGNALASKTIATTQQVVKLIVEVEKTLTRLKTQDLPKAMADLRFTSENLRDTSARVDMANNVGRILLVVGLLLAAWCFVHSLGALLLAKSDAFGSDIDRTAVSINS